MINRHPYWPHTPRVWHTGLTHDGRCHCWVCFRWELKLDHWAYCRHRSWHRRAWLMPPAHQVQKPPALIDIRAYRLKTKRRSRRLRR